MVIYGYRRVSTQEQAGSGLGLDAQQAAIEGAGRRLGRPVAAVFTDAGLSGGLSLEQRPALVEALGALRRGDVLVVAKRDRLGRDVLNTALIERLVERKGARIVSAAGEGTDRNDPTSKLMRQMIDAFAEYERQVIKARTKAALAVKKAKGERVGAVPFGYQLAANGVQLEPEAGEQAVIARMRALQAAGGTQRSIAAALNADGLTTRKGTSWRHQYVAAVLRQCMSGGPLSAAA